MCAKLLHDNPTVEEDNYELAPFEVLPLFEEKQSVPMLHGDYKMNMKMIMMVCAVQHYDALWPPCG